MSDVQKAPNDAQQRLTELRVSASLMQLDPGLYCVVVTPSPHANAATGLPGVRVTNAPGMSGRPDAVTIRTLSSDGWMSGFGDAALVRVTGGIGYVLLTIYQAPGNSSETAPNMQVLPLMGDVHQPGQLAAPTPALAAPATAAAAPRPVDLVAHVQTRGDVGVVFGEWLGEAGSGKWIEGFAIAPVSGVALEDIEYQVVLGRGWMSPWVEGGQYCGSRGMALPILGLRVRLRGGAAEAYTVKVSARFIDGTSAGPVGAGEACESEALVAVEAMCVELIPHGAVAAAAKPAKPAKPTKPAKPAPKPGKPAAKPAKPTGKKR